MDDDDVTVSSLKTQSLVRSGSEGRGKQQRRLNIESSATSLSRPPASFLGHQLLLPLTHHDRHEEPDGQNAQVSAKRVCQYQINRGHSHSTTESQNCPRALLKHHRESVRRARTQTPGALPRRRPRSLAPERPLLTHLPTRSRPMDMPMARPRRRSALSMAGWRVPTLRWTQTLTTSLVAAPESLP